MGTGSWPASGTQTSGRRTRKRPRPRRCLRTLPGERRSSLTLKCGPDTTGEKTLKTQTVVVAVIRMVVASLSTLISPLGEGDCVLTTTGRVASATQRTTNNHRHHHQGTTTTTTTKEQR